MRRPPDPPGPVPNTLRVLHVISSLSRQRGGPSVSMHSVLKALRIRGVAVDVVATDDDGRSRRRDVPLDRFVELEGQRVRYFPRQTRKYEFSAPLLSWLRANIHNYDIVHTHGLFVFAPLAAAWCARRSRVPYIMRPAGALDTWGMLNKSRPVKAASVYMVEAPLLRSAAAVHFTTPLEQRRAAGLSLSIRPVVLPTGVEVEAGPAEIPESAGNGLGLDGRRFVLFLARIHPIKRIDMLLRAFADLERTDPELRLVIAGDGDPALTAGLKRQAEELGVAGRVLWSGFVTGAQKRWLLSRASVFVLPSASENFGIAVVEALTAGLPVVVTSGCGLAEHVAAWGAGVVTDGTAEAIRAALAELLANESLRVAMGEAGRRAAVRELSLESFGAGLESLYRSILEIPGQFGM